MSYTPVGWANDETHPLSQANMKTLDAGIVEVDDRLPIRVSFSAAASVSLTDVFQALSTTNVSIPASWNSWHADIMFTGRVEPGSPSANRNLVTKLMHGAVQLGEQVTGVVFAGNPTARTHTGGSTSARTGTGAQTFTVQGRLTINDSYGVQNRGTIIVLRRVT